MSSTSEDPPSNSSWRRPVRLPRAVELDPRVRSIFYGYTSELVAQWCAVSEPTVRAWKEGKKRPTRQALKLFALYSTEQVLTPQFRGFRVRRDHITDPQGQSLSVAQLEHYCLILQLASELARRSTDPADVDRYYALLRQVG